MMRERLRRLCLICSLLFSTATELQMKFPLEGRECRDLRVILQRVQMNKLSNRLADITRKVQQK